MVQTNEMLNEVVNNFIYELNRSYGVTTTPNDLLDDILKPCYLDNFINSPSIDINNSWAGRYSYEIITLIKSIYDDSNFSILDSLVESIKNHGITRYVLDIHYRTLHWFIWEYDIRTMIENSLNLEDWDDYITLNEDVIKTISDIFIEAVNKHGNNDLFQ